MEKFVRCIRVGNSWKSLMRSLIYFSLKMPPLTKLDSFMCTFSSLNLGIVSICVMSHCGWEVLQDYHIGSGNFLVCIVYGHVTITDEAKWIFIQNFKKTEI